MRLETIAAVFCAGSLIGLIGRSGNHLQSVSLAAAKARYPLADTVQAEVRRYDADGDYSVLSSRVIVAE